MLRLRTVFTLAIVVCLANTSQASILLTVDTYTTDQLTFSISGAFDADTIGDSEGYLALKNDWSNNGGIHTELFSSTPTITSNSILIGGIAPTTFLQNLLESWNDNVFFANPLGVEVPILAGTTVTGSVTISGVGSFDPIANNKLELVSGFVRPFGVGLGEDWARLEASATSVPEPSSLLILAICMVTSLTRWWRHTLIGT